jgi:hypothetical protein
VAVLAGLNTLVLTLVLGVPLAPGALVATPIVGTVKRLYFVLRHGQDNIGDEDGG